MEIKKSEQANLENGKTTALLMGFVMVLALHFVALEWTQSEKEVDYGEVVAEVSLEMDELIPITLPEKKTTPPPPQSVAVAEILEIVPDDVDVVEDLILSSEDQVEFVDISSVDVVEVEEEPEEETLFQVVEKMPEFPGGTAELMKYLQKNIKYPSICRENNIQGRVYVGFIVNKDGSIVDVEIVKSIHPSLDKEAVRVVSGMPRWTPGEQRGKPVRVKFTLPVNFKLN